MNSNTNNTNRSVEQKLTQVLGNTPPLTYHTRQRIWNKAHVATRNTHVPSTRRYRTAYPLLIVFMLFGLLGGYTGVVVAAGPSVPGELLYPIERQAELMWLKLTPNSRRNHVQLVLLERRVYEARALLNAGKIVPDDVLQEIELLFLAVTDTATDHANPTNAILPHLITYQDTIRLLVERYPGITGLRDVLDAANLAVITLGGDPHNQFPLFWQKHSLIANAPLQEAKPYLG